MTDMTFLNIIKKLASRLKISQKPLDDYVDEYDCMPHNMQKLDGQVWKELDEVKSLGRGETILEVKLWE